MPLFDDRLLCRAGSRPRCSRGTQTEFAVLLNVPAITAISWENGTRKPSGAALRLLAVARHHPEALHAA